MKGRNVMKKLFWLFAALAVLLSDLMCAVVAYNYAALERCAACSAPASTAFLLAIPYGAGVLACALLAIVFRRRSARERAAEG